MVCPRIVDVFSMVCLNAYKNKCKKVVFLGKIFKTVLWSAHVLLTFFFMRVCTLDDFLEG